MFTSICLLELSRGLLLSHSVLCTSNYYIINEKEKEIKYSAAMDSSAHLPFHYIGEDCIGENNTKQGELLSKCFYSPFPWITI